MNLNINDRIAKKCGISRQAVYNFVTGRRKWPKKYVKMALEELNLWKQEAMLLDIT